MTIPSKYTNARTSKCTSLFCESWGDKYCPQCSHHISFGSGKDENGKMWRWSFNARFGPLFERKDGHELKRQPIAEDHPAWEPFERWHKRIRDGQMGKCYKDAGR